jgi:hypothetical protein
MPKINIRLASFSVSAMLTALLVFATLSSAQADGKLRVFEGAWSTVAGADIATHPLKPSGYTESWYVMVQAPDDLWIFLHYGITNLEPLSSGDGAVESTIIHKGKVVFKKEKFKSRDVSFSERDLKLKIGESTFEAADGGWRVNLIQKDLNLSLMLKPEVPGIKPGRTTYPGGEFYQINIAAPRARASGTLKLNGVTIPVSGAAYFDHSLQDYPAHRMADRLYSFRGFSAETGINFLTFITPPDLGGAEMPTLILMREGKVVARTTLVKMTGDKALSDRRNKYTYPSVWSFEAKDGETPIRGTITLGNELQRLNAAEDFNFLERALIKTFVANPMLYRHAGTFGFQVGDGDAATTFEGSGIAEVVILRQ